ncbi:MAG: IS630 family transposase [Nitrospirae bacterium]|nr:IS630 family transposase [Nitrospirota bacterium]
MQRILKAQPLHPHKVTYSLERRDPAFEDKRRAVLLVYQEVALHQARPHASDVPLAGNVITVSVDEPPGVQALATTAPDLPPVPGKHPTVARDHVCKRLSACSILAALDLHTGHVTARVERRCRSREFMALLKDLDAAYPPTSTIRMILDNHSAHSANATQAFFATRPNRFAYVRTPTHGSWLTIVETLFPPWSKNSRSPSVSPFKAVKCVPQAADKMRVSNKRPLKTARRIAIVPSYEYGVSFSRTPQSLSCAEHWAHQRPLSLDRHGRDSEDLEVRLVWRIACVQERCSVLGAGRSVRGRTRVRRGISHHGSLGVQNYNESAERRLRIFRKPVKLDQNREEVTAGNRQRPETS